MRPVRALLARSARKPTSGLSLTRKADANGHVSFAGVSYPAGRAWCGQPVQVAVVAGRGTLSSPGGTVIRVRAIRHDPIAEMGAFAVLHGRPVRRGSTVSPPPVSRTYRTGPSGRYRALAAGAEQVGLGTAVGVGLVTVHWLAWRGRATRIGGSRCAEIEGSQSGRQ